MPQEVRDALIRRGWAETDTLDTDRAFDEYCSWHGISGWGPTLRRVFRELTPSAADLDALRSEVARLRDRVRVDASDIERTGVTAAHFGAWLVAQKEGDWNPWTEVRSMDGMRRWHHYAFGKISLSDDHGALARRICEIAEFFHLVPLDILDEVAAMDVPSS